jgi:rRNA maturation endonuclease Nob1
MTTALALLLVITAINLVWVSWPLFRPAKNKGDLLDALQAERIASLKRSLVDLKTQFEAGSIAEDDFARMERNTMLELAKIYEAAGINPDADAEEEEPEEEVDHRLPCHACGALLDGSFKFCPKCGAEQNVEASVA